MKRLFALVTLLLATTAPLAHADYYHDGGSGYSWLGFRGSKDSDTGYYRGGAGNIAHPYSADWNRKLQAMQKYQNYLDRQQQTNTAACGFTGAPDYCYRLILKPRYYPADVRIVRF